MFLICLRKVRSHINDKGLQAFIKFLIPHVAEMHTVPYQQSFCRHHAGVSPVPDPGLVLEHNSDIFVVGPDSTGVWGDHLGEITTVQDTAYSSPHNAVSGHMMVH